MRAAFREELDQLRLQVELMAARVGENLERMDIVVRSGDHDVAHTAIGGDDEIDAMLVSLTARCYDLLARESPVAGDLRFLVSVLRMLEELGRIGDLGLRVVKQAADFDVLASRPPVLAELAAMSQLARDLYRIALDAWSAQDLDLACSLVARSREMDERYAALVEGLIDLHGDDSTRVAIVAVVIGRALGRIADHTVIVGERLRYLLTGDPAYLASEIR